MEENKKDNTAPTGPQDKKDEVTSTAEVKPNETKESKPAEEKTDVKEEAKGPVPSDEKKEVPATSDKGKEVPAPSDEEVEVPAKFKKIVEEIENMSVLDLNELVTIFEKKFGVSATAVATVSGGAGPASGDEEVDATVNVELTDGGATKIAVIKVIKEILGLGLKDAKDLVDGTPSMLKTDVKKEEAEEIKKKVEEAGGKVTFK